MVKSKEGTSAFTNIKEKKSLLDDEIGQDFLGSWNSMSVTQDDAMDFNFGTVLSGQKKTFNFDKLDMDFNLDADFNEFSSFKVDMPDLDFPSPSEKTAKAKPKERTEDSSTGNYKGKKDHFSFSFDFNDEDFATDVQFGSNLVGSSKSLTRKLPNDKPVLPRSEENVKELSNIREDFNSDGGQNRSKVVSNFRLLNEQGIQGESNLLSSEKNPQEDLHDNDVPIGDQLGGNSKSSSRETSESEPGSPISENNVKDFSDIREGFNSDGSKLDGDLRSLNKQVIQDEPAMLCSEKNSGEDLCANNVQIQNLSRDNSKSVSSDLTEGEPVLLRSDSSVKNSSNIREAFESDSEQNGSKLVSNIRLQDEQAANEESVMPGTEYNTGEGFNTNDAQVGRKLVVLKSLSKELTKMEPVLEESRENDKSPGNIRKGMNIDSVQVGSKFGGNSKSQEKETTIQKPIQPRSDKNSMKCMNIDSVQVGSKFGSNSKSQEKETTTANPVQLSDMSSMEAFETDGEQSKPVSNIRPQDKQATKDESVMPGSENNTGEGFNINDAQVGKKLVVSKSLPRKLKKTETFLEESKKNDKNLGNIRKGINNNGIQVGSKFVGNSRSLEKEAIIGKTVLLRSDKSSVFQVNSSSQTEKIAKSSTQARGNPKFMISSLESIQNLKNHSAEGHKIGKRTPELPSLKILRTTGASRDIPSPTVPRQNNSLRNLEQKTKLAKNKTSKIAHPVDGIDKQKPLTQSLKRKISEESNADLVSLKPLKRLSESPKETRSLEESSGEVVEEETSNNENQAQSRTKNVLHNQPTPRLEVSEGVNRTEVEIPLFMENNGNVEKAEAYTKELEDICNMLKKKHEEAKELLVRAIVNNNNLLMLNHPIYEEKIRMVQDFATLLTLKEIPVDH